MSDSSAPRLASVPEVAFMRWWLAQEQTRSDRVRAAYEQLAKDPDDSTLWEALIADVARDAREWFEQIDWRWWVPVGSGAVLMQDTMVEGK